MHKCHPHLERHFCRLQIQWKVPSFEAHSIPSPTCASLRSIFLCCQLNMIIMNSRESDIKKVALNKNISRIALCSVSNGEGNGTPLQYSCLENPMGGGACQAVVHGVAKSQTRLSDFAFTFHFHALEKAMATHSSVLVWRIPGMGEPGELPSIGSHRVRHD